MQNYFLAASNETVKKRKLSTYKSVLRSDLDNPVLNGI
jgi:hypothetical protein